MNQKKPYIDKDITISHNLKRTSFYMNILFQIDDTLFFKYMIIFFHIQEHFFGARVFATHKYDLF